MRRLRKRLFLLAGVIISAVFGAVIARHFIQNESASAESGTVTSYQQHTNGITTIGLFQVNGSDAWCFEHDKTSPSMGTSMETLGGYPTLVTSSSSERDQLLFKIMYYGQAGGYGQIPIAMASSYVFTEHRSPSSLYSSLHDTGNPLTAQNLLDYATSAALPAGMNYLYLWYSPSNSALQTLGQYAHEEGQTVTVTKIWKDNSNAYGTRPTTIRVHFYVNGSDSGYYYDLTGTGDTWTQNVLLSLSGTISLVEDAVAGYRASVNGTTITNTLTDTTSISATKIWKDNSNAYGTRPSSLTFNVLQNGNNYSTLTLTGSGDTWTGTKTGLPMYDANGVRYVYTLMEPLVGSYSSSRSGNTFTNTLGGTTSVTVTKVWSDYNNADNTRPGSITVRLLRNNATYDDHTLTGTGNTWSYTWSNLPLYDANGVRYTYTVAEPTVPNGYTRSQSGNTITNTYQATTSISVTKNWVDWSNKNNTRPTNVSIDLMRNNSKLKTVTFTGTGNSWSYTESGLEKYDANGNLYTYTWKENSVPSGYTMSQNGNTITNTASNSTSTTVTKAWKDNSNAYSTRPTSVSVDLLRNGTRVKTVTINGTGNNWTHTENGLEKYDADGNLYTYTWRETSTPGNYYMTQEGNVITNTLIGFTELSMNKVWVDNNNRYNTRPTSIEFEILRNGSVFKTVTLSGSTNNWSHTEENLAKYDSDGVEYTYTVREKTNLNDYVKSQSGNTITNTLTMATAVRGQKIWVDNSNAYRLRPSSVTLKLYKTLDGETKKTEVSATPTWQKQGDTWSYEFANLPLYENGIKVSYSVSEVLPENYKNKISGFDVTNTLYGKVEVSGTKTWKYNGAPNRVRPAKITVVLLQNGTKYQEKVLTEDDMTTSDNEEDSAVWEFVFEDLDKYDENGVLYEYTIEELEVDQFETIIEETDITNTYKPDLVDIHVDKVWLNDSEADRPGKIDVELIRDGEVIETVELNNETGWEYDWEDLDSNYEYTVHESYQIPGYYPGATKGDVEHGFTIENKKIPKNPKTFDGVGVAGVVLAASTVAGAAITIRKRR